MRGRVAKAAVQSALTVKVLEFLSSLMRHIAYGFGPLFFFQVQPYNRKYRSIGHRAS